jgi:hypothetical protein
MAGLTRLACAAFSDPRGGLDLAARGGDDGPLSLLGVLGLADLLLGDQLLLVELGERGVVPLCLGVGGVLAGQLGLGGGQARLGLAHAAFGVGARLVHAELVLAKLLVQHRDLVLGELHAPVGLAHGGLGLLLAGADLLVVEDGDDLSGRDPVALAHGDLADPARGLGGHGRVVALDPAAHGDDAGRQVGRREEHVPHPEAGEAGQEQRGQSDHPRVAPLGRGRRPGSLCRGLRRAGRRRVAVYRRRDPLEHLLNALVRHDRSTFPASGSRQGRLMRLSRPSPNRASALGESRLSASSSVGERANPASQLAASGFAKNRSRKASSVSSLPRVRSTAC